MTEQRGTHGGGPLPAGAGDLGAGDGVVRLGGGGKEDHGQGGRRVQPGRQRRREAGRDHQNADIARTDAREGGIRIGCNCCRQTGIVELFGQHLREFQVRVEDEDRLKRQDSGSWRDGG